VALAARAGDIERSLVLVSGGGSHADPLGIGGHQAAHACRAEALEATSSSADGFRPATARGAAMTLHDLITYALAGLETTDQRS